MIVLEEFLKQLYKYLIGNDDINNNIIRKHTNKITVLGDLSIPKDINNWKHLVNDDTKISNLLHFNEENVKEASKQWILHVASCIMKGNDWYLFLDKKHAFALLIKHVLDEGNSFGSSDIDVSKFHFDETKLDISNLNLTDLRIHLTELVIRNVATFLNCTHNKSDDLNSKLINFTTVTNTTNSNTISIMCSAVLNDKKTKNLITTPEELYRKRAIDMRLMAEHKYGLRISSQPGWQEFYEKLGQAAVTMELLQNKPNRSIKISLVDNTISNNKGAAFLMYNCARIAKLFKEFDRKVDAGFYPKLQDIDTIDFSLLTQPEEWQLLYVHIMQFPITIKMVIKDITMGKVYPHYIILALSSLCSTFSVYYRRVKILMESRSHMIPTLFARIYLLKAVEQVLHNGLHLLNIEPVKQMCSTPCV